MNLKKISWLICSSIVLTTLLSACAPQPAPTEKAKGPAAEGKTCEGVKIVFFTGGPPRCPFGTVVYNGALAAAADLGADVEYMFSDWDPKKMVRQFGKAITTNPDGIAIMGHPGDDALEALVDEARAKGIIVTSQNTTLPVLEAAIPVFRLSTSLLLST